MATPPSRLFGQAARPSGRAFGEAGSLRPDTMTGFDRRDEVTGMQNEQNRESSLYNRIFRQQSRASRKGDINAGLGALETMGAARAAGVSVGGIRSFDQNRNFAAGTLGNIEEQTSMMEGGGQWQDDGQGGSSLVARTAAPVSGAMGMPEVPGMQKPPEASMASSFQEKVASVTGGKLGGRADADGSLFERLTGVNPNLPEAGDVVGQGVQGPAGGDRGTINGMPTAQALGEAPRKPSLAEQFAKEFPNTSKLLGLAEQFESGYMGSEYQSEPLSDDYAAYPGAAPVNNYDPSKDPELAIFEQNKAAFGRDAALKGVEEAPKAKIRAADDKERDDRAKKRKKTLVDMAAFRDTQRTGFDTRFDL